MSDAADLERLWSEAPESRARFDPEALPELPAAARRHLAHALPAGAPLARAVRLTMHGEIKVGTWCPFRAEQVIAWPRGMLWAATARKGGLPIRGSDRVIDGRGAMRWKLLGLVPVVRAEGADITRSALGRFLAEAALWLPQVLADPEARYHDAGDDRVRVDLSAKGERAEIELGVDGDGALRHLVFPRWGDPGAGGVGYAPFGGVVEEERRFDGIALPSRMRAGWHFGTDRFETEGEFFRVTIDSARFR